MLEFKNVTYTYPFQSEPALRNISLSIAPGELVVCTGASGCGKSTLIRLANGLCPHYFQGELQGKVCIEGKATQERGIAELSAVVGTLFQDPEQQFFALNVEDELVFALEWKEMARPAMQAAAQKAIDTFGLEPILQSSIHTLSEGQKQKVGLASLYAQSPKILILDEPSANLDPEATAALAIKLQDLKEQGMAIFVVDHRLYWLENIADKVLVMQKGEVMVEGDFSLLHDDSIREKYGLRSHMVQDNRQSLPDSSSLEVEKAITIKDLHFGYKGKTPIFVGESCSLPYGITVFIGDNGTGKTTMARILSGLQKYESGTFTVENTICERKERLRLTGIVLQNADHQLHMRTVLEEVLTSLEIANFPKQEMENKAMQLLEDFGLEHLAKRHPQSLSGGEKQRLVVVCALAKKPSVLILDEPTSGLDGTNMQRLVHVLKRCEQEGMCILLITHDLELLHHVGTQALRLPLTPIENKKEEE